MIWWPESLWALCAITTCLPLLWLTIKTMSSLSGFLSWPSFYSETKGGVCNLFRYKFMAHVALSRELHASSPRLASNGHWRIAKAGFILLLLPRPNNTAANQDRCVQSRHMGVIVAREKEKEGDTDDLSHPFDWNRFRFRRSRSFTHVKVILFLCYSHHYTRATVVCKKPMIVVFISFSGDR